MSMKILIFAVTFLIIAFIPCLNAHISVIPLEAIKNNDVAEVRKAIENGVDVNGKYKYGRTALMMAIKNKSSDIAMLLIENGANVNAKDATGGTALMTAAFYNCLEIAKLLIDEGVDTDAKDMYGMTALIWAAQADSLDVAKLLIDEGIDVNVKMGIGHTALIYATVRSSLQMVKLLIDNGADVNVRFNCDLSIFFNYVDAVYEEYYGTDEVEKVIGEVASNVKSPEDMTTLMWAALFNSLQIAELLIDNGADVNAKNKAGETALMLAERRGYQKMITLLKEHRAK